MAYETTREFFARVFPWPEDVNDAPAYLNIHWTSSKFQGQAGRACSSLDEAVNTVKWVMTLPDVRDVYFCTTAQLEFDEAKTKDPRNKRAKRSSAAAVRFKALCIDVDAKGTDKDSYASLPEAADALATFVGNSGLPKPNAIVLSGGGLHVYWTFAHSLTREQWAPLARALVAATRQHGLKCDTQCTIDAARILRVPETLNHKTTPPRNVRVAGKMSDPYALEKISAALVPYMGLVVASPAATLTPSSAPRAAVAAINSALGAGVEKRSVGPIGGDGIRAIMKGCSFLGGSLKTGGAANQNPLWHQSVLAAAFLENGRALAHAMSSGHASYTLAETDKEFDRVEKDIAQRDMGWPSCRAIHSAGHGACATCPHFAKGKSPINLGMVTPVVTATPIAAPANQNADLPPGYKRLSDLSVTGTVTMQDGTSADLQVIDAPMYDPWLQTGPMGIHFKTKRNGRVHKVFLENGSLVGNVWLTALHEQGIVVQTNEVNRLRTFLVSWIDTLQKSKDAVRAGAPFGWEHNSDDDLNSSIRGFAFGEKIYLVDGKEAAHIAADEMMRLYYRARGDRQLWIEACRLLVTEQDRVATEVLVAASFAAPLVKLTGHKGLVLSGFSAVTGAGKSTASIIGQAVWASPTKTQTTLDGTENSIFGKMGMLRNLPIYWDENREIGGKDIGKFAKMVFRAAQGVDKSRMGRDLKLREPKTWDTMMISTSNDPLLDSIDRDVRNTEAGAVRLFEFEVGERGPNAVKVSPADAQQILGALDFNYGHAGAEYAAYIARNHKMIEAEVAEFSREIEKEVGDQVGHRLWRMGMVTILLGAKYANGLGLTKFHLEDMRAFLAKEYGRMAKELKQSTVSLNRADNLLDILQRFLSTMQRHTVYTNKVLKGAGKPPPNAIQLLRPEQIIDGVYVHIGVDDKVMRISSAELIRWLAQQQISRKLFFQNCEKMFGMVYTRGHLAGGTKYSGVIEYFYEFQLVQPLDTLLEGF